MADWKQALTKALSGVDAPTEKQMVAWMKTQPADGSVRQLLDGFATSWTASRNGSKKKQHTETWYEFGDDEPIVRIEPATDCAVQWLLKTYKLVDGEIFDAQGERSQIKAVRQEIEKSFNLGQRTAEKCVADFKKRYESYHEDEARRLRMFTAIPRSE